MNKEDEKAYFREKLKPYITEVMTKINERDRRRKLYDDVIGTRESNIKPCLYV